MKRSVQKRKAAETRVLAFPVGAFLGAMVSPLAWWAFRIPNWKAGAIVTIALAVVFGVIAVVYRPKNLQQLVEFFVRILNP